MTRRSVILDLCIRAEFHTLILVSLYLLFCGHNRPGGGFSGGLVAACACCLLYVSGGGDAVRRAVSVAPTTVLGGGLLLAVLTGMVSLALGHEFLESAILQADLALLGHVKVSTVLVFDTGVYLVVVGMALLLLDQLGAAGGSAASDAAVGVDEGSPTGGAGR